MDFCRIHLESYAKLGIKSKFASLPVAEQVYSFNYTNTNEILYRPNIVEHIHGNTNTDIVLGVNPDKTDEVYSIDTAFLQFKKYFQRTFYSTDNAFLKKIYVLYHSDISAKFQIRNLVEIYGKQGLDRLRAEKDMYLFRMKK